MYCSSTHTRAHAGTRIEPNVNHIDQWCKSRILSSCVHVGYVRVQEVPYENIITVFGPRVTATACVGISFADHRQSHNAVNTVYIPDHQSFDVEYDSLSTPQYHNCTLMGSQDLYVHDVSLYFLGPRSTHHVVRTYAWTCWKYMQ